LGAFLFHGDEVYRRIGELSGGEQSRLAFLKLMLTGANFLVLDEPTNHLDIPAKEAVEEALMAFPGTFLVVSHDRYFLDKVANCTLELEDGRLTEYGGGYSYYRMKKEEELQEQEEEKTALREQKVAAEDRKPVSSEKDVSEERGKKEQSQRSAFQGMSEAKRQELIQRAEAEIAMAEAELKGLEFEMNQPELQADPAKSQAIAEAYAAKEKEIEERYAKWERLTESLT
ncbi:MAG: ABC-F family ATP-binding cassette domain-containing protein, partial [Selenomonadaceae bacterium]|nr:ABC-F family ATP-binding cassette domain-containing protein [Selenomonadaceae bacterium]